jgi:hypothetical protein
VSVKTDCPGRAIVLLLAGLVMLALPTASSARIGVALVDDRGRAVDSVAVCWYQKLETKCLSDPPFAVPRGFESYESVSAEGPRHGPVSVTRGTLSTDGFVLQVPRKGAIFAAGELPPAAAVSFYRQDDPLFRKPVARTTVRDIAHDYYVPTGKYVVSISSEGSAPFLQLVALEPGARAGLKYRRAIGWSLLVRVRDPDGSPQDRSTVTVKVYNALRGAEPIVLREIAHPSGLAVFNGLQGLYATARATAPRSVPTEVRGISAAPGSFTVGEIVMDHGGEIHAQITLDGHAASGIRCQILDQNLQPEPNQQAPLILGEGLTDAEGRYRPGRLPPGKYIFRTLPTDAPQGVDELVSVLNDNVSDVMLDMMPITIEGHVYRGDSPAPGVRIEARRTGGEAKPAVQLPPASVTDDEGHYELALWLPDTYWFLVMEPDQPPADSKFATVGSEGATIDFRLRADQVNGIVQDEKNSAVADASVLLVTDHRSYRMGSSDASGRFSFSTGKAETLTISAEKEGYAASKAQEFNTSGSIPAVVIELSKSGLLAVDVFDRSGRPLSDVLVASYQVDMGSRPVGLDWKPTSGEGRAMVARARSSATRIFITGPGCPLSGLLVPLDESNARYSCSPDPSSLDLILVDPNRAPLAHEAVVLRNDASVIPGALLSYHLAMFGIPVETDGSGRLNLIGLEPGGYQIYLMRAASEESVMAGASSGFLASVRLGPKETAEIEVKVDLVEQTP